MMVKYLIAFILAASAGFAGTYDEDHYNRAWCEEQGGQTEVVAPSGARVDCLLPEYAVEADWSNKWAEAIGQSLHYAGQFDRRAGVLFLVHEDSRPAHLLRLEQTIEDAGLDITIFVIDAPKY